MTYYAHSHGSSKLPFIWCPCHTDSGWTFIGDCRNPSMITFLKEFSFHLQTTEQTLWAHLHYRKMYQSCRQPWYTRLVKDAELSLHGSPLPSSDRSILIHRSACSSRSLILVCALTRCQRKAFLWHVKTSKADLLGHRGGNTLFVHLRTLCGRVTC